MDMDQLAQRLQQERLRRGLSTFELAERTKIREPYIQALESGTYNVLPSVYVRSFVRTLGAELGITQPEISRFIADCIDGEVNTPSSRLRQTAELTSTASTSARTPEPILTFISEAGSQVKRRGSDLTTSILRSPRKRRWIAVGVVILAVLLWWYWKYSQHTPAMTVPAEIVDVSTIDEQDSLILTAVATDTAELTLTIDGTRSFKAMLVPENDYRWSAMKRFTIGNIFNAGALQFSRDGKPLPVYGKRGEVLRELVITRTEVSASNTSVKVVTPASAEAVRRDSVRDQQRRDSIRAVRKKENARIALERRTKTKTDASARSAKKQRTRASEQRITKSPPRPIR